MAESRRPRRQAPRARRAASPHAPAPPARDLDGPVVELEVERVAHGGVFVAHHEGRVVFVSDAIPGERVSARVTDRRHDRFWRAETLEVLDRLARSAGARVGRGLRRPRAGETAPAAPSSATSGWIGSAR